MYVYTYKMSLYVRSFIEICSTDSYCKHQTDTMEGQG